MARGEQVRVIRLVARAGTSVRVSHVASNDALWETVNQEGKINWLQPLEDFANSAGSWGYARPKPVHNPL